MSTYRAGESRTIARSLAAGGLFFLAILTGPSRAEAEKAAASETMPREDVPAVPQKADIPGEQPLPSVRAYPTGEIPADPHLALGYHVYRQACMVCHDRGAANTPPITNLAEWVPRIAQGREVLYSHAINGFKGSRGYMPPKGGSPGAWSDEQVRAAVDYMVYVVGRLR